MRADRHQSGPDTAYLLPVKAGSDGANSSHLGFRVGRVARLMRKRHDSRATEFGLTRAQWHTISVVRYNEGKSQRCIAEILEVGEVTAGRMIALLEDQNWLERRVDPDDGRASRVYLGVGAGDALRALDRIGEEQEREALAGLSSADIAQFVHCIDTISRNLSLAVEADRVQQPPNAASRAT